MVGIGKLNLGGKQETKIRDNTWEKCYERNERERDGKEETKKE